MNYAGFSFSRTFQDLMP